LSLTSNRKKEGRNLQDLKGEKQRRKTDLSLERKRLLRLCFCRGAGVRKVKEKNIRSREKREGGGGNFSALQGGGGLC